jgi:hypothetical protein
MYLSRYDKLIFENYFPENSKYRHGPDSTQCHPDEIEDYLKEKGEIDQKAIIIIMTTIISYILIMLIF